MTAPCLQAKQAAKQAKKDVKTLEEELKNKSKEIEKFSAKLRKMGAHGAAIAGGGGVGLAMAGSGGSGDMSPGYVVAFLQYSTMPLQQRIGSSSRVMLHVHAISSRTRYSSNCAACFCRTMEEMDGMTEEEKTQYISKRREAGVDRENTGATMTGSTLANVRTQSINTTTTTTIHHHHPSTRHCPDTRW
jgi:hypothetical protein